MARIRVRVASSYGESDVEAVFDDHTTVAQLADEIETRLDRRGDRPRTIKRTTRGEVYLSRDSRLAESDIRSGDRIALALDSGLRAGGSAAASASLRVISGPDEGRTFELRRGESTIGRSKQCDVILADEMASRKHAVIRVSDIVEVADGGSTNGVVINDAEISGVVQLKPGDRLTLGDTTLVADLLGGRHEAIDVADNAVEFNRPPRIDKPFVGSKIKLPTPPGPAPKPRIPMISALAPLLMGAVLFAYTRRPESVLFIAMSPLMMFGSFFEQRRGARKDHREREAEYLAVLDDQIEAMKQARDDEAESLLRFSPSTNELLGCVTDLTPRLWERQPGDADFLHLRIGLQPRATSTEIELPQQGRRDDLIDLAAQVEPLGVLPPVPVTFDARLEAPIGLAGPVTAVGDLARSMVLQTATLHSPNELHIGALTTDESADDWSWIKWMPHAATTALFGRAASAVGPTDAIELLSLINELIEERTKAKSSGPDEVIHVPHLMLVVDGDLNVERSRFSRLLDAAHNAGITVLWLSPDARRIPHACRTVVSVEPGGKTVTLGRQSLGTEVGQIPLEGMPLDAAEVVARAMAPIVDISAALDGAAQLPTTSSLIDLLGGLEVLDSPAVVLERWHQAQDSRSLRAPVGVYEGGALLVDMRVDGPHGLVGGTTGAGKSEFLQAMLTSLAASHSPDRLNFLLVDYKGGAAFGDLVDQFEDGKKVWDGLRHSVGMITDLTPALVQRALVSLQAELHRREIILNEHRAKDLQDMEKRRIPGTPPSLLTVVDEFAALAKEVPAFVDGVVDIAQRGRSLGLHLILATQKPGGVVTPNIQANTNLRVALRMASEEESTDVVKSPIAGQIDRSTPGRGVMRRGPSDLVAFQSAYVGSTTTPATLATLELAELSLNGTRPFETPQAQRAAHAPESAGSEPEAEIDVKRLVRVINAAADSAGLAMPDRPWLDPLPQTVDLFALPRPESDALIPIGLLDIPHRQARDVATFDPDVDGSLLIYGRGGSGKTVALRSMLASFGLTKDRSVVHAYGLDFAGRGLEMASALPHVGDIVVGEDYERITTLLKQLRAEVRTRGAAFAAARASTLAEFRRAPGGDPTMARIVVALDGFDNFTAAYERIDRAEWLELVPRLVADGRQVGIHFLFTGTRRSSFPTTLSAAISKRLVFRMASDDDYHAVNVDPKLFDESTPAGRCRVGDAEVQIAILGSDPTTAAEDGQFQRLGAALAKTTSSPAPPVAVLPDSISIDDMPPTNELPWLLTEGFEAVGPSMTQHVLIAGPARSGKTTALASLMELLERKGTEIEFYAHDPAIAHREAKGFDALVQRLTTDETGLIFIESVERLAGSPAEFPMQQAVNNGQLTVVATADSAAARGYDQTMRAIRSRCDVVLLQPDPDMDGDLLGAPLARTAKVFPPGRGIVNLIGDVSVVQVATR